MENTIDSGITPPESTLTRNVKNQIDETRKWALFFGILGIIGVGLLLVGSIGMLAAGNLVGQSAGMPFMGAALGFVYLLMAFFYILPIYYLFKFNSSARQAVQNGDIQAYENSHKYMKLLFRFMGVMTIIVFFVYIALIISAVITATASGARPF